MAKMKTKTQNAVNKTKSERLIGKGKKLPEKKKKKKSSNIDPEKAGKTIGCVYYCRSEEERIALIKKDKEETRRSAMLERQRIQEGIILSMKSARKRMQETGFVFNPSDEVLVNYYLKHKSLGWSMSVCPIDEVEVYADHPRILTEQFNPSGGVWYFFTKSRPNVEGEWKLGEKKDVFDNGVKVGVRQELEFYEEGDENGNGKYKMIEYQLHPAAAEPLFICKLSDACGN